ncbi:MAG TPA: cupin domain-containing protein [Planctomycetota bacterium]|jgi:quercetin dioxygenase-like cupin family protein|nr:cupin domain-containing protein [Planctomycetota bacterium]
MKKRRPLLALLLFGLPPGCRMAERVDLRPTFSASLDEWLASRPLGPGEALRVDDLHAGGGASLHVVQARAGMPAHYHRSRDETVVGLRGEARMVVAGETIRLRPGVVVHVPRRMVHEARVEGAEPCAVLLVFTPPFDGRDRVFVDGR